MATDLLNNNYSNNEENLLDLTPDYSLFSLNQVALATFLGGPFAGFYMIYYNLKKLESANLIWRAAAIIFGVLLLSFLPDILGTEDILPGIVYSVAYAASAWFAARYVMENKIIDHENNGGVFWGSGRVALVIIINVVIMIAFIAAMLILTDMEGFKEFLNE